MNQSLLRPTLASLLLLVPSLASALVVSDTFEIGDPATAGNDAADPLDVAWVAGFNSAGVSVASAGALPGNYLLNDATSGFSMIRAALPTDGRLDPGIGDTITLSFDFRYLGSPQSSTTGFRF